VTAPIAVTMGDPAGVGPEIALKAWSALHVDGPAFFVVGDPALLGPQAQVVDAPPSVETARAGLCVVPAGPGVAADPARTTLAAIEAAVALALAGKTPAVVTNPIAKARLYAAGFAYPGHTEYLAALCADAPGWPRARGPVMMLTAADLRVALVTIHEPLARVPSLIDAGRITDTVRVVDEALRTRFAIARPRIAVAGLNPHAGESGAIGREDAEIVAPAVAALRAEGLDVAGPLPADTLFHAEARSRYDAAVCLYHDQGLIPVKMLDFWGGVNVTLGLPIIRTSPDHGTADDIAGQGLARPDSLIAAIRLADVMARARSAA
jgi:4-hydroxythreonine-4-phosphate dehydrogenase